MQPAPEFIFERHTSFVPIYNNGTFGNRPHLRFSSIEHGEYNKGLRGAFGPGPHANDPELMSALGHKRTCALQLAMSAKGPIADMVYQLIVV